MKSDATIVMPCVMAFAMPPRKFRERSKRSRLMFPASINSFIPEQHWQCWPVQSMLTAIFRQSLNKVKSSIFITQPIFLNYRVTSFHFFLYKNFSTKFIFWHGKENIRGVKVNAAWVNKKKKRLTLTVQCLLSSQDMALKLIKLNSLWTMQV